MKNFTLMIAAFFLCVGAVMAQTPKATDANWKNNAGIWEKDVTPAKFKFSQQTTEEAKANIFAVPGKSNPDPAITSDTGHDLTDGYIAVSGGQITGPEHNENLRAGFEIVDGKLFFNELKATIKGYKNMNFCVSKEIQESNHNLKIVWPVNFKNEGTYTMYAEGGANDPEVAIPAGESTIEYTQTATSKKPFRLKMGMGGANEVTFSQPVFSLITNNEPQQVNVSEDVGEGGSVTKEQTTQLHVDDVQVFTITPNEGSEIESVTFDGVDVTKEVSENGKYTTPKLTKNNTPFVVRFKAAVSIEHHTNDTISITAVDGNIQISGLEINDLVSVYHLSGKTVLKQTVVNTEVFKVQLPKGIYIVKVNDTVKKIIL